MGETKRTVNCPKCGAENLSWRWRCQTCNTPLHEDQDVNAVKFRRRDPLERLALICGIIGAGAVAFVWWFIFAFASGRITDPIEWLFVLGTGLLVVGSTAVARKRPLIGGVLLIVQGFVPISLFIMGVFSLTRIQSGSPFWWILLIPLVAGLLLLASGVLFLLSRRKGRRLPKGDGQLAGSAPPESGSG